MNKKFIIAVAILVLSACAAPQAQPSPTPLPPTSTPLPATDTPSPTVTLLPPSATPIPPTPLPPSPTPEPPFSILEGEKRLGDAKIHYICYGEGSPTILLESGGLEGWRYWRSVMEEIAPHTRICSYDRPGTGESERVYRSEPRTSLDMAADMYNLLIRAGLAGPYILVGHSAGGFNVLVYANQYPQDVVGMVLVDPSYADTYPRMLKSLPPQSDGESSEIADCRSEMDWVIDYWKSWHNEESWDFLTSFEQVRAISSLGDIPLIVLTDVHDRFCRGELGEQEAQIWKEQHAKYAALSTNGTQIITDSGHMLPATNPKLIIDAILQVLEQVRSK